MKTIYTFLLFFLFSFSFAQNNMAILPKPQNIIVGKGNFYITAKTLIQTNEYSFEANYLKEALQIQTGLNLKIASKTNSQAIQLVIDEPNTENFNKEQYYVLEI